MLESLLKPHGLPEAGTPHRVNDIHPIQPGEEKLVLDVDEPGCVRYFYTTINPKLLREVVLRFYWDGEAEPSVECPLSDFFGVGHDLDSSELNCLLFYNAPFYGYNCYIPMPFNQARMTVTNESEQVKYLFFTAHYETYDAPLEIPWRFHAVWRRVFPAYRRGAPLTLLEARGDGKLIGTIYHIVKRDSDDRWSHGGGDHLFIDGDTPTPRYIYGVGGEDYAHHAWGLYPGQGAYAGSHHVHPVPGVKRGEGPHAFEPHGFEQHDGGHYSMYRFYVPDPVRFHSSIRFGFGTCENEISATVYWYQNEPHAPFAELPERPLRHYGCRLTEETTLRPLAFDDVPVAVLGPVMPGEDQPWSPRQALEPDAVYETNVRQPYGDVVRPPHEIRWRRSSVRGGFIDLAAIHRPKVAVRARGLWNKRSLPVGVMSYQWIRAHAPETRRVRLRVGFEDELEIWHNGSQVATLARPAPKHWTTQDVELDLTPGANDIVLPHAQQRMGRWSAWGLYVRFLTPEGELADGLTFEAFDQLDPTPERWREPWPPDGQVETDQWRDPAMLA